MSTSYTTRPLIGYEDFLKLTDLKLTDPTEPIFTTPSKIIEHDGAFIHLRKDESGCCEFTRFGKNNIHKVFPHIIAFFGVGIFDEYGMQYPDCLD